MSGVSPLFPTRPGRFLTATDVHEAAERLVGRVHRTPVMTCRAIDRLAGRRVYLKCENLQRGGAFKIRGATNAILQLPENVSRRGVVTHSSGNHAQALALAAASVGITADVVMPEGSPKVKVEAVREAGGRITRCEPTLAAREAAAEAIVARTGAIFVHPYDHDDVIAGQGTIGLEILADLADVAAIVAPVGGGGMLAGLLLAASDSGVCVIGAEPAGAADAAESLSRGERVPMLAPNTIADGLRTSLGERTWPIIQRRVREIITVSEAEIIAAMRLLFERAKLVVEPSGAVALAATLQRRLALPPDVPVAVVLSGGNVDLDRLPWQS